MSKFVPAFLLSGVSTLAGIYAMAAAPSLEMSNDTKLIAAILGTAAWFGCIMGAVRINFIGGAGGAVVAAALMNALVASQVSGEPMSMDIPEMTEVAPSSAEKIAEAYGLTLNAA